VLARIKGVVNIVKILSCYSGMHSTQTRSVHQPYLNVEFSHSLYPFNQGVANCTFFCFPASLASILNALRVLHIVGSILVCSPNLWRTRETSIVARSVRLVRTSAAVNEKDDSAMSRGLPTPHALLGDERKIRTRDQCEIWGKHLFEVVKIERQRAIADFLELILVKLSELGDLVRIRCLLWVTIHRAAGSIGYRSTQSGLDLLLRLIVGSPSPQHFGDMEFQWCPL
jgi:hypothetical protein